MSEAPKSLFEKFTDAVKEAVENPGKFITDTFNGFVDSLKNVIPTFIKPATVEQKQAETPLPSKVPQSTTKTTSKAKKHLNDLPKKQQVVINNQVNDLRNNIDATQKTPIKPEHGQAPEFRNQTNEPRPPQRE